MGYAIESHKNYSFERSPQNMSDIIQSALKKGISDSDKSTQSEAMNVLSLFSIIDETKAERVISRMSGSAMSQFQKSATQHNRQYALSSPKASVLTSPNVSM